MTRIRVYVAGPYSSDKILQVLRNMREGMAASEKLFRWGYSPFCPWLDYHFEFFADHNVTDFYAYSMAWLESSDIVVMLTGWENSHGSCAEKARAEELGIPVYLFDDFIGMHMRGEVHIIPSLVTKRLQRDIADWSRATFGGGKSDPDTRVARRWGMLTHLGKEFDELVRALDTHDDKKIKNELADCALLLFDMAEISGVDIGSAMQEKLDINKRRKWGKPDDNGCVEHIKE